MKPAPLTGLAIGDALGMPFETAPPDRPDLVAWDGLSFAGDTPGSEYHGLKPGQWTDDTQMSLALTTALLQCRRYDPEAVSRRYLRWFESPDCRGIGGATKAAMERLKEGRPWYQCGTLGALGNGPAMRAAPIALTSRNPDQMMANARTDAIITHRCVDAEEGSVAVAFAVFHLLDQGAVVKETLLPKVLEVVQPCKLRDLLHLLWTTLRMNADLAEISKTFGWDTKGAVGNTLVTVPAALACFLTTRSYQEAVVAAIKLGGDTDTTGAITGAMAGTYYGYDAIPEAWRAGVEEADKIRAREIELLLVAP